MSTTVNSTPNPNRKWWALVRLVCYLWIIAMLYMLDHYEPDYHYLIAPAISTMYFAVGHLLGRNRRLIRAVRQSNV